MAQINFTEPTYDVDNIQGLADQPTESAIILKQTFDKTGSDAKDYTTDTLIAELKSTDTDLSGAQRIGYEGGVPEDNVKDALDLIYSGGSGTIPPDGTITTAKLASDVKESFVHSTTLIGTDTYTTTISDVTDLTDLQIIATITNINTGASTLDINSIGVKNIKYYDNENNKQSLKGGELTGTITLTYDGTDFIVLGFINTFRSGSNVIALWSSIDGTSSTTYVKIKEFIVYASGVINTGFILGAEQSRTTYGLIYVNDIAVGTERSYLSPGGNVTYSSEFLEDITVKKGDKVQLYGKTSGINSFFKDFKAYVAKICAPIIFLN